MNIIRIKFKFDAMKTAKCIMYTCTVHVRLKGTKCNLFHCIIFKMVFEFVIQNKYFQEKPIACKTKERVKLINNLFLLSYYMWKK